MIKRHRSARKGDPDALRAALARNLKVARLRAGLTLRELAEAMGVSAQQAQKYESGVNRIAAERLSLAADRLDVALSSLFEDAPQERQGGWRLAAPEPPLRATAAWQALYDELLPVFARIPPGKARKRTLRAMVVLAHALHEPVPKRRKVASVVPVAPVSVAPAAPAKGEKGKGELRPEPRKLDIGG